MRVNEDGGAGGPGVAPSAEASPADARRRIRLSAALAFVLVFGGCVYRNDFPYWYHPDEPLKAAQVISGERNFHHPPLMLTLTHLAVQTCHVARQSQAVVDAGRWLAALCMAAAAVLLTLLAGIYGGPAGALGAALTIGTDWQVIMAGHFFKEDPLFTLGLAAAFYSGALYWRRRSLACLLLLGASAGLAASAKYVGVVAIVYAVLLAALTPTDGNQRRLRSNVGWCALGAIAVLLLCNGWALFGHFHELESGILQGAKVAQEGNRSVGAQVPNWQFTGLFFLTPAPVLLGLAVFWFNLRQFPFRQNADRWLNGLSPLWLLVIISFSAVTAIRYFLPISAMLGCLAGASLPDCARWLRQRSWWNRPAALRVPWIQIMTGVALLVGCNLPKYLSLQDGFAHDERADLRAWIARHLPPSAVIVQDDFARLNGFGGEHLAPKLFSPPHASDLGDVQALRAQGITHILVCWFDSRRYVDAHRKPAPNVAEIFERRHRFYEELPRQARLVWQSPLRQPYPLCPGLELYAIQ